MTSLNLYLAYKRDTSRLVFWIVKASNAIIASSATLPDDAPKTPNTNGQITVSSLVSLSKLIAKHINPVPFAILALFDSAIQARTATYEFFQQLVVDKSDPEVERDNVSHKHFINALVEAFEALGGVAWTEKCKSDGPPPDDQADLEQALFANKFVGLSIDGDTVLGDEGTGDDGSDVESQQHQAPRRHQQQKKSSSKGKKVKHGKNANKKKNEEKKEKQHPPAAKMQSLDDVPVESYCIIRDEEGTVTDYLMAVFALVQEWVALRAYLQGLWQDVAYKGLNSAVAGALSNVAINIIERSAAAMFIDFPGHDSYETVMNTITRGDPDKIQGMFHLALHKISPDQASTSKVQEIVVNVKEQFLIHAYQDFVDFITDFQKNRSGKPTKGMRNQIRNWDPNLNLQRASEAERLKWRRSYTINWLYDLVNVFSSIVVQRNTIRGEQHVLELVDWSTSGPWDKYRRLFGLNEFAGIVTHLAMQKPDSDMRHKILPHHIFQLQCIVDSFTVSRGWYLSILRGHVLRAPPRGFRPRRDVDLFLDRENERFGSGYLQAVDILKQLLQKNGILNLDIYRYKESHELLELVQGHFDRWLGESKYMHGLIDIPGSRFSTTNSNGLWEYSPFLCGVGLEEGLREAYKYSLFFLDIIPEAILVIHLHNMLVQKGYIAEPVGLYASFQDLFPKAFFSDGKVPTSNFGEAIEAMAIESRLRRPRAQRTSKNVKDLSKNWFFKTKSYLMTCHGAGWNPDRIPDSDIPMPSFLGIYRISQTKHIADPTTGQKQMEDRGLIRRIRAKGISDEDLMSWPTFTSRKVRGEEPLPEALREAVVPKGYSIDYLPELGDKSSNRKFSSRDLLDLLKLDISDDICGDMPLSGLNYVWTVARFMILFHQFERELGKLRNPLYVRAYETESWRKYKRVGLTLFALKEQDEECLHVMAREFQNPRVEFTNHIYWEDLEPIRPCGGEPRSNSEDEEVLDQCSVM